MSAHLNAIDWYRPIGPPNAWRSLAYATDASRQPLRHAERERGDRDAPVVEDAQERLEAFAANPEQMIFGNATPVEHELVRVGSVPTHLPVGRLHDEARRAASTTMFEISFGAVRAVIVTHFVIAVPELVMKVFWPSITHSPVGVVERGLRLGRARIGTGLGFGETERTEHLARDHRDEILLLLRLGAAVEERGRAEAHAGLERDRHRRVDARDLLDRDAVRQVVGAAAAVLLGKREAEQAERAHGAHGVDGKRVIAVPVGGVRRDLRLGEVAHDGTELLLLRGRTRTPRSRPYSQHYRSARGCAPGLRGRARRRSLDHR